MREIAKYHEGAIFTNPVGAIHELPTLKYSNITNSPANTNLSAKKLIGIFSR